MRLPTHFLPVPARVRRPWRVVKNFLRAMAECRGSPIRTGDLAELLKVRVSTLGPLRSKLIKKGMIYSPAHGELAYSVPLFGDFMKRAMPNLANSET